ncbi:unnamed protein product [Heligmosomoides polygyrus]|uniref:Lipase n=1 Tax=Heligmosomoides polygyrus TaxID=6339 RepID=A0A183FMJ2_HELPZ|nr:unnamed protein product [Heligmosomoides polygyrus]
MASRLLWITVLLPHVQCLPWFGRNDPEVTMTVPQIVEHWGYPVEIYKAVTQDGYILELHRIPHGRNGPTTNGSRPVIFLQHGLECSSSNWVTNLPEQSAAFVFADAGFDVWMGNMRGNKYSKRHVDFHPSSSRFWEFTWDEMAQYDLPAMINQALVVTGQPHVYYVGHSQGTLTMFSKLSTDPAFAQKIKMFFALAPVGSVKHIKGLFKTLVNDFTPEFTAWTKVFGAGEFYPNNWLTKAFSSAACANTVVQEELCKHFLFSIAGPGDKGLNKAIRMEEEPLLPFKFQSRIAVYLGHTPSGTSSMNILHWIQMVKTGTVAKFDYGEAGNLAKYGKDTPPLYNFKKIPSALPIHIFTGGNDWLADNEDINGYLSPNIEHLQGKTVLPEYNHLDFIWGLNAARDVYHPIANHIIGQHFASIQRRA